MYNIPNTYGHPDGPSHETIWDVIRQEDEFIEKIKENPNANIDGCFHYLITCGTNNYGDCSGTIFKFLQAFLSSEKKLNDLTVRKIILLLQPRYLKGAQFNEDAYDKIASFLKNNYRKTTEDMIERGYLLH